MENNDDFIDEDIAFSEEIEDREWRHYENRYFSWLQESASCHVEEAATGDIVQESSTSESACDDKVEPRKQVRRPIKKGFDAAIVRRENLREQDLRKLGEGPDNKDAEGNKPSYSDIGDDLDSTPEEVEHPNQEDCIEKEDGNNDRNSIALKGSGFVAKIMELDLEYMGVILMIICFFFFLF